MKRRYWLLGCLIFGATAMAIDIDGVVLGQASCEEAIQKSYKKHFGKCMEAAKLQVEKNQCKKRGDAESEMAKFKEWNRDGVPCYPGFGVHSSLRNAFNLKGELFYFSKHNLKTCPFEKFYVESQFGIICYQGKAVFYEKEVKATVAKVKKQLTSKYGTPTKIWKSNTEQLNQLVGSLQPTNILFSVKEGKILLVQTGSAKAWPTSVYYFTDSFLKRLKDDSAEFNKLQKKPKPKPPVTEKNSDLEEL